MKLILVVDDERFFPALEGTDHVHYAATSEWAMMLLFEFDEAGLELDELWLDHDLGGDDTTRGIVNWLEECAFNDSPYPVAQIMVHSMNAPAAAEITSALSRYYNVRRVSVEELNSLVKE